MAKQKSVLQFRGKLGQIVGMKNGFGGSENFARSYVADPKNPQTAGQTAQRIRLLPAVNFRRQLQSVISRAWEGTKYGGASTRKFMKYALKEPLTNIPQVVKDESLAIPGKYLVSRGSLAPITTEFSGNNLVFGLPCGDWSPTGINDKNTLGYLTKQLIKYNSGIIENGDQLTIICVYSTDATNQPLTQVIYKVMSIVLDAGSDVNMNNEYNGVKAIDEALGFSVNKRLLAGCIVLSREGAAHLRNTTRMEINESDEELMGYFAASLKADVRASYVKSTGTASLDWPYEEPMDETTSDGPFMVSTAVLPAQGGLVEGGGTFYRDNLVVLNATPNSGYFFDHWEIDGKNVCDTSRYQFRCSASVRVVAVFNDDDRP